MRHPSDVLLLLRSHRNLLKAMGQGHQIESAGSMNRPREVMASKFSVVRGEPLIPLQVQPPKSDASVERFAGATPLNLGTMTRVRISPR